MLVTLACAVIVRLKPLTSAVLLRSPDVGAGLGVFSLTQKVHVAYISFDKMEVLLSYIKFPV